MLLDTFRDGTMILQLVTITPLEAIECAAILERYGRAYLKMYQQTSPLADKVVEWYIQLVKFWLFRAVRAIINYCLPPRQIPNFWKNSFHPPNSLLEESRDVFQGIWIKVTLLPFLLPINNDHHSFFQTGTMGEYTC